MEQLDGSPQPPDGPLAPVIARLALFVATPDSKKGKAAPLEEPLARFHAWLVKLQETDMRSRELANDAKAFLRDQCFAYTVSSATVAAAVDGKQDEASVLKNKATAMLKATKDLIDCLTDTLLDVPGGMPTRAGQKGEEDKKVYGDLLLALLDGLVSHLDPHNKFQKQPPPEDLVYRDLFGEILLPSLFKIVFPDPAGVPAASGRPINDGSEVSKIRAEIKYMSFGVVNASMSKHTTNRARVRRLFTPDHLGAILQGGYDAHLSAMAFECAFYATPSRRTPSERADFCKRLFNESRFGKGAKELRAAFDSIEPESFEQAMADLLARISNGSIKRSQPFRALSLNYNERPLLSSQRAESSHKVVHANAPSLREIADGQAYEDTVVWLCADNLAANVPEPPEIVKIRRAGDPRLNGAKGSDLEESEGGYVRMVIGLRAVQRVHVEDLGRDPNVAKVTILISADSPARFGDLPHPALAHHVGTALKSLDESQVGDQVKALHKLEFVIPAGSDNLNILNKTLVARKERYPKLGDELHRFPIRVGISPPSKTQAKERPTGPAKPPAAEAKPASNAKEAVKNVAFAPTPSTSTAATATTPAVKRAPRKSSEAGPVVAQPVEPMAVQAEGDTDVEERGHAAEAGAKKVEKAKQAEVDVLAASQEAARRRAAEVAGLAELDKASSVATSEKTRSTESEMRGLDEDALAGQEFGGGFEEDQQAGMDVDGVLADGVAEEEEASKHKTPANPRRPEGDASRAPARRRKEGQQDEAEEPDDVTPSQQRQKADMASSDLSEPSTEASDVEVEQTTKKKKVVQVQVGKKGKDSAVSDGRKANKAKKAGSEVDAQSLASGRPRRAAASKAAANLRGQKRGSPAPDEDESAVDEDEAAPKEPTVKKGKKVKKASPPPSKRRKTSPTASATADESEETDYDDFPGGGDVASTLEEKKPAARPSHKYGKEPKSVVRAMGGRRKAGKPVAKAKAATTKAKKRQDQATDDEGAKASGRERTTSPVVKPKHHAPKKHVVVEDGATTGDETKNAKSLRSAKEDKRIADDIPPPRDLTQGELERAKGLDPRTKRASRPPEEKSPAKPIRSFSALVGREEAGPEHQRLGKHIIEGVGRLTAESEEAEEQEENVFEAGPFVDELDDFSAIAAGLQAQAVIDTSRRQMRSSPSPFIDPARDETFVERAVAEASTSGGQVFVTTAAQAVVFTQKRTSPALPSAARTPTPPAKDVVLSPRGADDSGVHFDLPIDAGVEADEEEMAAAEGSAVEQDFAGGKMSSDAGPPVQGAAAPDRRDVKTMLVEKPPQARVPLGIVHPFSPAPDSRRHRSLSPEALAPRPAVAQPTKAAASAMPYLAAAAVQRTRAASPACPSDVTRTQVQAGSSTLQVPRGQASSRFAERNEPAPAHAAAPAVASTSGRQPPAKADFVPWGGIGRPVGRNEGPVGPSASTSWKKPVSAPSAVAGGFAGGSTSKKAHKPKQHVKGRLDGAAAGFGQQRRARNGKGREKAPLLPPISSPPSSEPDIGAEAKSDWQEGEYEMDTFLTKFFRAAIVEKQAEQRRQREAHHELSRQRLMGRLSAYVNQAHNDALVIANNVRARLDAAEEPDSPASNLRKYAKHAIEVNTLLWEEAQRELEKIAEKEKAEAEAAAKGK